MKTIRTQVLSIMSLGIILTLHACVPGRLVPAKDSKSTGKDNASADANEDDSQAESVSPPVPITGSYLHCEIHDQDIATKNRAEVACRIDDGSRQKKVNLTESYRIANFLHQKPLDSSIIVSGAVAEPDPLF